MKHLFYRDENRQAEDSPSAVLVYRIFADIFLKAPFETIRNDLQLFCINDMKDIPLCKKHPRKKTHECFSAVINTAISVLVYYHIPENIASKIRKSGLFITYLSKLL